MSIDEIELFFEKKKYERKKELIDLQTLSTLITNGVAIVLNGSEKVKEVNITTMFPDLFNQERKEEIQKTLELNKAKMDLFVQRFNKRKGV